MGLIQRRLDHRVAAAGDPERRAVVDHRAHVTPLDRELGQRRGDVEGGKGAGAVLLA